MKNETALPENLNNIETPSGIYASHWGLSDLYDSAAALLKALIESGKDFSTDWWGAKKEIVYAKYTGTGDELTIEVAEHMDDLWESDDLIEDALYELEHKGLIQKGTELSEEDYDYIRDVLLWSDIDDKATAERTINRDTPFEKILETADEIWDEAHKINHDNYEYIQGTVLEYITSYKKEEEE